MRKFLAFLLVVSSILVVFVVSVNPFAAPSSDEKQEIFILDQTDSSVASFALEEKGFVKSGLAFEMARAFKGKGGELEEGGYYLSKNMDAFQIAQEMSEGADLKWVRVLPGMRKEQIGEILQRTFDWSEEELEKWNLEYTAMKHEYLEGVYYPDSYLIPVEENGLEIAQRMINNFNEKFDPYFDKFSQKDIQWTTGLRVASLIQRESAGTDMKLISGIIWNRLERNQKLDIDATVQYVKGERNNWWPPVFGSDIQNLDSRFNTYKYVGLPPTPIANPTLDAIEAALNPDETDCLYYLHSKRQIYCSETYEEHLENIDNYLR